ncbi:helix-turn-helix domain-containing protein [Erysipelothrix tonsillarum]|uniref:helix-turn-helix domain-containing protein n=2 Tax=Erysipelothrix tonsillarum TaxID=38402 RepID=UPI00035F40DF
MEFDMIKLGKCIASQRKEMNETQSQLAERMGVSHQAISSWENGLTSPDISKLIDLSHIFNISIDTLMGNEKIAKAVGKIKQEEVLNADELVSIAPIMKPEDLKKAMDGMLNHDFDFEMMLELIVFLDDEHIDQWMKDNLDKLDAKQIIALAPFLSDTSLRDIVSNCDIDNHNELIGIAPFLEKDAMMLLAAKLADKNPSELIALAPFLDEEGLAMIVDKLEDISDLIGYCPFLSEAKLDEIVDKFLGNSANNPDNFVGMAPFLAEKTIKKIISHYEKEGRSNEMMALRIFV